MLDAFCSDIARFFLCLFVRFPAMQVSASLHARFAALVVNLRALKARATGRDVERIAADAAEAEHNASVFLGLITGGEPGARRLADFQAKRRQVWCGLNDLGLTIDTIASLGDWQASSSYPLRAAESWQGAGHARQLFSSSQDFFCFMRECLSSMPRDLYFRITMCVAN